MASKVETVMAVIAEAMNATDYTFYGTSESARHGNVPRIVWIEDDDETFEAPGQQQSRASETCAWRKVPIDVELWGADTEQSELLYEALIAALVTTHTRYAFELRPSRKKGTAVTKLGHKRILSVFLKIPVERAALSPVALASVIATVKAAPHTPEDDDATYTTAATITEVP